MFLYLSWEDCIKSSMINKKVIYVFIDLKKVSDAVPREMLEWTMVNNEYQKFYLVCIWEKRQQLILYSLRCLRFRWRCIKYMICHLLFLL